MINHVKKKVVLFNQASPNCYFPFSCPRKHLHTGEEATHIRGQEKTSLKVHWYLTSPQLINKMGLEFKRIQTSSMDDGLPKLLYPPCLCKTKVEAGH